MNSPNFLFGGLTAISIVMLAAPHFLRLRPSLNSPFNWERAKWKLRQVVGHLGFVLLAISTILIVGYLVLKSMADGTFYYKPVLAAVAPVLLGLSWKFIEALWLDQDACSRSAKELMDIALAGYSATDGEQIEEHIGSWVIVTGVVTGVDQTYSFDKDYQYYQTADSPKFHRITICSSEKVEVRVVFFPPRALSAHPRLKSDVLCGLFELPRLANTEATR